MISGATILSSTKEEAYSSFIKRRLSKIAIPFFAYSVLYYLFYVFVKKEMTLGVYPFVQAFARDNISGHFWYIYALLPLYFIFPFFRKLVQNLTQKQLLTLICIFFVINSFIPSLNEAFSMFSNFKIYYYSYGKAGVYLNYTLIGYYIHNYVKPQDKNLKTNCLMLFTALASVGGMTLLTYFVSGKKIDQTWLDITWPFVIFYSVAVMVLAKIRFETKPLGEKLANFISKLGVLSFSAYLVHMLALRTIQIYIPRPLMEDCDNPQAALLLLIIFIVGVLASYLWAFIVSKLPLIKKIL
jgi:surface polysaccharide O-acyltransferase-like enzyme